MAMKKTYNNRILSGLLALLMAALWASCSEDTIGTEETNGGKSSSVTFHLGGIEGLHTRAADGTENFNSDKYGAKLYLFKDVAEGSSTDPNNPYPNFKLDREPVEIKDAYVTIDELDRQNYNYIYIIVGYEKDYENEATVKSWNANDWVGTDLVVGDDGSLYTTCYIAALDENNSNAPYTQKGEEPFMIYGAGGEIASQLDQYIPVEVVLTRQMGAVVFSTGAENIEKSVTCTITTDYYHLYLSQIIETVSGTRNHSNDYAGANSNPNIEVIFDGGFNIDEPKGYMLYLPCTTTKEYAVGEHGEYLYLDSKEYANYFYDSDGVYQSGKTSIEFGNKTYSTSELFPIYPNRRTILTIGDGSKINVSFGDEEGKIDQEGDWNGGL